MSVNSISQTITEALKDGKITSKEMMQIHREYRGLSNKEQNKLLDKVSDYLATYQGSNDKAFTAFQGLYGKIKTWKKNPPPPPKPEKDWNGITQGGNKGHLAQIKDQIEILTNQGKLGELDKIFDGLLGPGSSPFFKGKKLTPNETKELVAWLEKKIANKHLHPDMKKRFEKALGSLKGEIKEAKAEMKEAQRQAEIEKERQARETANSAFRSFDARMKSGATRLSNKEKGELKNMLNKMSRQELELLREQLKDVEVSGGTKWSRGRYRDGVAWMLGEIEKRL